jgi:ankyrin repeat protein
MLPSHSTRFLAASERVGGLRTRKQRHPRRKVVEPLTRTWHRAVHVRVYAIVDRGGLRVVQFSHFSVKEYLTSERLTTAEERLSYYHILPEPAHTSLAHISLSVLLHLDDEFNRETITHSPLAPYAARYWVDHAQFKNVSSHIEEVMERLFDPGQPHFAAWVWLYDIDRYWTERMPTVHPTQPEAGPLYYASLCGFVGLAEHMIAAHSEDVNREGGSHTTPLHAASVKGHLEVASLLLRNGADPDSRDHLDRVPLHRVSHGGQLLMEKSSLEIARLLVNSGADVNVPDYEGCAPLHAAAQSGYREVAELLLGSSASLDARNNRQRTPLRLSCEYGKRDMAQFLIDCGSDIHSRDEIGFIPLHAWAPHASTMRIRSRSTHFPVSCTCIRSCGSLRFTFLESRGFSRTRRCHDLRFN